MTRTSTGPFVDSSFNPSCSCTAVKMDGCTSPDDGSAGNPAGVHLRSIVKFPVSPVRSNTMCSTAPDNEGTRFATVVLPAENMPGPAFNPAVHGEGRG